MFRVRISISDSAITTTIESNEKPHASARLTLIYFFFFHLEECILEGKKVTFEGSDDVSEPMGE